MARPRTTVAKLPKGWQKLLQEAGEQGASLTEMRKVLGIGRSAWDTLIADSPEFQAAVKDAEDASAVWWERTGRRLASEGGGNSAIWIFNMKNRFGWRDAKQDESPKDDMAEALSKLIDKLPS